MLPSQQIGRGSIAIMSPQLLHGDCGRARICSQSSWVSPQVFGKSQTFSSGSCLFVGPCSARHSCTAQWGRVASSAPAQPLLSSRAKNWFIMADPTHSKKKLVSVPQKLFFYLFIFRNMFPANLVEATFKQVSGYIPFTDERHEPALYETSTFVKHNPDTDMAYDCRHCWYLQHLGINESQSISLSSHGTWRQSRDKVLSSVTRE